MNTTFSYDFDKNGDIQFYLHADGIKVNVDFETALEHQPGLMDELMADVESRLSTIAGEVSRTKSDRAKQPAIPSSMADVAATNREAHEDFKELMDDTVKLMNEIDAMASIYGAGRYKRIDLEDEDETQPVEV